MSAGDKLVTNVWVDGQWYGPGDDLDASVAKQISNPKAFGKPVPENSVEAQTAAAVGGAALPTGTASGDEPTGDAPAVKKTAAKKATAKKTAAKKTAAK